MKRRTKVRKAHKIALYEQLIKERGLNINDYEHAVSLVSNNTDENVSQPGQFDGDDAEEFPADDMDGAGDLATNSQPGVPVNALPDDIHDDLLPLLSQNSTLDSINDHTLVETYEDLCKMHFDRYLTEAQRYGEENTEIHKNVQTWKGRLQPLLNDQETRPKFNMRTYASRIMKYFWKPTNNHDQDVDNEDFQELENFLGKEYDFGVFVENKPQYEVCRRFLTALHLANYQNIELVVESRESHDKINKQGDLIHCKLVSAYAPVDFEAALSLENEANVPRKKSAENDMPIEPPIENDEEAEQKSQSADSTKKRGSTQEKKSKAKSSLKSRSRGKKRAIDEDVTEDTGKEDIEVTPKNSKRITENSNSDDDEDGTEEINVKRNANIKGKGRPKATKKVRFKSKENIQIINVDV